MEVDYDRGTLRHSSFQEGAAPRAGQDCASLEGIRTDPRVADQLLRPWRRQLEDCRPPSVGTETFVKARRINDDVKSRKLQYRKLV